jgi:hypothetical protein
MVPRDSPEVKKLGFIIFLCNTSRHLTIYNQEVLLEVCPNP